MKLTKVEAKKLSLEKWQMIIEADGEYTDEVMEKFKHLKARCGYCEKYSGDIPNRCIKCPIRPDSHRGMDHGCCEHGHPWEDWSDDRTKETAQAVYDLIKKS